MLADELLQLGRLGWLASPSCELAWGIGARPYSQGMTLGPRHTLPSVFQLAAREIVRVVHRMPYVFSFCVLVHLDVFRPRRQVMEAHILAVLTQSTQHLILIGEHGFGFIWWTGPLKHSFSRRVSFKCCATTIPNFPVRSLSVPVPSLPSTGSKRHERNWGALSHLSCPLELGAFCGASPSLYFLSILTKYAAMCSQFTLR